MLGQCPFRKLRVIKDTVEDRPNLLFLSPLADSPLRAGSRNTSSVRLTCGWMVSRGAAAKTETGQRLRAAREMTDTVSDFLMVISSLVPFFSDVAENVTFRKSNDRKDSSNLSLPEGSGMDLLSDERRRNIS